MIELYTAATPNGWKISILLEELNREYQVFPISLMDGEQKSESFLKMNPNGKIPAIKDTDNGRVIFESAAIMLYLTDSAGKLAGDSKQQYYQILQWLMFQVGGVGPMMGQANVFFRYFPEKIPSVIDRYHNEVKRLFAVMDEQLKIQEYLAGDAYTIADIANWSWVHIAYWGGVEIKEFKYLNEWVDKIAQRPAVQKGINVPKKLDEEAIKKAGQKIIKN